MDGTSVGNLLKQENARSLGIVRVVLNNGGRGYALDDLSGKQAVRGEFVVSMLGDPDVTGGDQAQYALKCASHDSPFATPLQKTTLNGSKRCVNKIHSWP